MRHVRVCSSRNSVLSVASALLAFCLVSQAHPVQAAGMALIETGSTLMQPLLQGWAQAYAKAAPDVQLSVAGTDSGAGITAVIDGTAQIGASDAYMSDLQVYQHPGILNIPLAISAQTVNYNLPELKNPLRLNGVVLVGIYRGNVRDWSDSSIAALNPGVTLPHHAIVPIRRSDESGDTFIFTQFLSFSARDWETGPGFGTAVRWPDVPGAVTAQGNAGMVKKLADTPYGVAYVGGSYADDVGRAELGTAELQNDAGQFLLPTPETVSAAAASLTPRTPPDQRLTLVLAPGAKSYPLINYEYAMVRAAQPNEAQAAALRAFLLWAVNSDQGGAPTYLSPVHFIALPTAIRALSELQIAQIH
jgi:phosphate transport system substrate-binding protein